MNVLYLLKTLKTNKLSELVAEMDASPLDINLAIWEAIDRGEIEINEDKDQITALKEAEPWYNPDITNKLLRTIQHYAANQANITRGRLTGSIKDPVTNTGYPMHEYFMSLQYLVDNGTIVEEIVEVPKTKKRPLHKFVFLCLPENDNQEWNARTVNNWIDNFESTKVE